MTMRTRHLSFTTWRLMAYRPPMFWRPTRRERGPLTLEGLETTAVHWKNSHSALCRGRAQGASSGS